MSHTWKPNFCRLKNHVGGKILRPEDTFEYFRAACENFETIGVSGKLLAAQ